VTGAKAAHEDGKVTNPERLLLMGHEVSKLLRGCQGGRARLAYAGLSGACDEKEVIELLLHSCSHAVVLFIDRPTRIWTGS